jgi:hypothetical protein
MRFTCERASRLAGPKRAAPLFRSGIISLASRSDLLYCAGRAGGGPRFPIMATVLDDIPAPATKETNTTR